MKPVVINPHRPQRLPQRSDVGFAVVDEDDVVVAEFVEGEEVEEGLAFVAAGDHLDAVGVADRGVLAAAYVDPAAAVVAGHQVDREFVFGMQQFALGAAARIGAA